MAHQLPLSRQVQPDVLVVLMWRKRLPGRKGKNREVSVDHA
jgi:hypothetical protein